MALTGGGFSTLRRWAGAAEGLGTSIVVVVLVAAVVYAASRPTVRARLDLTETEQYTLSEQTRQILADLPAPVKVTTLFRPEFQQLDNGLYVVQQKAAAYVRNLLREYELASDGDLTLENLDPFTDPIQTGEVVREFGITRRNVVLLECETRSRQVFLEELVTIDRGFANPESFAPAELRAYHAEGPLTSALLGVTTQEAPVAGFLVGYGGPDLSDMDVFGLGLLRQALQAQGFDVRTLDLSQPGVSFDGLDVLALVGPARPLGRSVLEQIEAYHAAGGALFIALDSWRLEEGGDSLLALAGLRQERAIVTRDDVPVEGPERSVIHVHRFGPDHPITAPIARQGFFGTFPSASHLGALDEVSPRLIQSTLVITDKSVFGDRIAGWGQPGNYVFEEDKQELRWERVLAFAVEGIGGRVVAFGGSGFMINQFLGSELGGPANMDLVLNAFNWLTEREQAVAARPREAYESRVELYEGERRTVFLYVIVVMPLVGALLGVLVWFARRR